MAKNRILNLSQPKLSKKNLRLMIHIQTGIIEKQREELNVLRSRISQRPDKRIVKCEDATNSPIQEIGDSQGSIGGGIKGRLY